MKAPSIRIPELKIPDLPKPVRIAATVIGGSLLFYLALYFTLGMARDEAVSDVVRLRNELQTLQKNLKQSRDDFNFVSENQEKFEALMASDKLVPHTRRSAIRQMQSIAMDAGLTTLNYNFQAAGALTPESVAQQPKNDLYRVYVENIELNMGAPLDQGLYVFIAEAFDSFPGSMIINDIEIERAPIITNEALNSVSRGQESGLVKGKIRYSWRTAQQNQQDQKQ